MRKRQVKKFAQNAKKNATPYREATTRGSKKHVRRHRAFGRYYTTGLANWDAMRIAQLVRRRGQPRSWQEALNDIEEQVNLLAAFSDPRVLAGEATVQVRYVKEPK